MEKKITLLLVTIIVALSSFGQRKEITWSFSATKVGDKTYELHMTATLAKGWFIYSQKQPEDMIGTPCEINFVKNPLLLLSGEVVEKGKLERKEYAELGYAANVYHQTVEFVQVITLKANVKTNVTGSVDYQICDQERCMPQSTAEFNVSLL